MQKVTNGDDRFPFLGYHSLMKKSPAIAYMTKKIRMTGRAELLQEIQDAPLKKKDRDLIIMSIEGASYKEMSAAFNLSMSRIAKWKHEVFEHLFRYEMARR